MIRASLAPHVTCPWFRVSAFSMQTERRAGSRRCGRWCSVDVRVAKPRDPCRSVRQAGLRPLHRPGHFGVNSSGIPAVEISVDIISDQ